MGFDLDKIDNPTEKQTSAPVAKKGFDLDKVEAGGTDSYLLPGANTGLDPKDFSFQLKVNANNKKLRAQNQTWYKQAGLAIGNAVANTGTGLIEGLGYLGSLATEWGDDRDYSNALTKTMQEWHNPLGQIYRENPNATFDLTDSAWWFENVQQLAESAGAFALEGAGLGAVFGNLATKAAGLLSRSARLERAAVNAAGQLATAATLAYTEGAMSGYRTYDAAYKYQYDTLIGSGLSHEEADKKARHIASTAAATTVQMNTIMNTVLGLTALAPMFKREEDLVEAYMRKKGAGALAEGETLDAWKKRLTKADFANDPELKRMMVHREGITSLASEAFQEGVEEVNTQYAEKEGKRVGEGGPDRSLAESLTDLSQYFNDVTDQEGALNFILGAFGGVAQTVLLDHIPTKKILKFDSAGNPIPVKGADGEQVNGKWQKQLVTARVANEFGIKSRFEDMRDAAVHDITNYQRMEKNLADAILSKNEIAIQNAKDEMFRVGSLDAIRKGNTESWQQQYREVGQLDNTKDLGKEMQPGINEMQKQYAGMPDGAEKAQLAQQLSAQLKQQQQLNGKTEAILKGYAKDMNDNGYKKLAEDAVVDLQHLQKLYDKTEHEHFDHFNPNSRDLTDHIFERKANLYLQGKHLAAFKAKLDAEDAADIIADLNSNDASLAARTANQHDSYIQTIRKLQADHDEVIRAQKDKDIEAQKALARKYSMPGFNDADLPAAMESLKSKLNDVIDGHVNRVDQLRDSITNSPAFTKWQEKNPDKSVKEFIAGANYNLWSSAKHAEYQAAKSAHDIAQENLKSVLSPKGHAKLTRSIAEDREKTQKELNKEAQAANVAAYIRQMERNAAATIGKDNIGRQIENIQKQIKELEAQEKELSEQIKSLHAKYKETKKKGFFSEITAGNIYALKIEKLRKERSKIFNQIENLAEKSLALQEAYKTADAKAEAVAAQPVPAPKPEAMQPLAPEEPIQDEVPEHEPLSNFSAADFLLDDEAEKPETPEVADIKALPAKVITAMDKVRADLDGKPFSYDVAKAALDPLVQDGTITQNKANELVTIIRQSLEDTSASLEGAPDVPIPVVNVGPTLYIPRLEEPDSEPTVANEEAFNDDGIRNLVFEDRDQRRDAMGGVTSALEYKEFVLDSGEVVIRNVMDKHDNPVLDKKTDTRLMVPGGVVVGSAVTISVDTAWDGTAQNPEEMDLSKYVPQKRNKATYGAPLTFNEKFSDFTDDNGKIRMETTPGEKYPAYANMPIKIVTKDGVTTYLPKVSWIEATKGTGEYRNVVDMFRVGDEWEMNNVQKQVNTALALRKLIAERYNANPDAHSMETRVSNRSIGNLMYSGKLSLKTGKFTYTMRTAGKQLPSKTLTFAVMGDKGKPKVSRTEEFGLPMEPMTKAQQASLGKPGAPLVLLPMPNGKHKAVPLLTTRFSDRAADVRTVLRAIELYLQSGTPDAKNDPLHEAHIKKILDTTQFDLSTEQGLKDFINQHYTYTQGFEDGSVKADAAAQENGSKKQEFMLAIGNKTDGKSKGLIKVGTAYSGKNPVYANLVDGKLSPEFAAAFTEGIQTRFKNVALADGKLKGVKSVGEIYSVRLDTNGKLSATKHESYNEYLKTFTYTAVYGGLQAKDGTYIYGANASVQIDSAPLWKGQLASASNIATELTETKPDGKPAGPITEVNTGKDNLHFDDLELGNNIPLSSTHTVQITPEGEQLTLSALEDFFNITPSNERNGQSPEQVLENLKRLNITKIADGYNPFMKCS